MKENVMSVSASADVVNVGVYEIDFNERNKINSVKILEYYDFNNMHAEEMLNKIQVKCKSRDIKYITIDCIGSSKDIDNYLRTCIDFDLEAIVYPCYQSDSSRRHDLSCLNNLIIENKIVADKDIYIDFSKFKSLYDENRYNKCIESEDTKHNEIFKNIVLLVGYIEFSRLDTIQVNKKIKINTNLSGILEILIDDLFQLKKLDKEQIDKLTRLIDKVNYIRGQY